MLSNGRRHLPELNILAAFCLGNSCLLLTFTRIFFADPNTESRLPLLSLDFYVPSDERFDKVKLSDFLAYALKSVGQLLLPEIASLFDKTPNEFDTFQDVLNLYEGGIRLPNGINHKEIRACIPGEFLKELARSDGERFLKFPMPDVIKGISPHPTRLLKYNFSYL